MAAFQVYCDESGEAKDQRCISLAAVAFDVDEVPPFARKWGELLGQATVQYVTMKEAMNLRGEFRDWHTEKRDELLAELGKLLYEWCDFQMDWTIGIKDSVNFRKVQATIKSAALGAFEGLMKSLSDMSEKKDHRFHLVYDISEGYSRDCVSIFNRLRSRNATYKEKFTALSFADDSECAPLQAADLLAYCCRQREVLGYDQCKSVIKHILGTVRGKRLDGGDLVYRDGTGLCDGVIHWPMREGLTQK